MHFDYARPLTNCFLQSSTDLVHWDDRFDFFIGTNTDGSELWSLRTNPFRPCEFYRVAGDAP